MLYLSLKMNCNPVTLLSKKERARIANHSFNTILQAVAMQPAALVKRNFSYAAFFCECPEYMFLRAPVRRNFRKGSLSNTRKAFNDQK